jgi:glycine/D-amino acid oxidase-like deaminating enzyme
MFPTRDQLVQHIERHAAEARLELRFGTTVEEIVRDDGGWRVRTARGDLHAAQVIVATGYENQPIPPRTATTPPAADRSKPPKTQAIRRRN